MSLPAALPAALDLAVLKRRPDGLFVVFGEPPAWLDGTLVEREGAFDVRATFSALASFLEEADAAWREGLGPIWSGTFTEADASGRERPLSAQALTLDGHPCLFLGPPTHTFEQMRHLLQATRDDALAADRLQRRIEEREVLLHCIVHDLSNPLQNLRSSLQLLAEPDVEPAEAAEMLGLATRQTDRMQAMIREVLTLFKAEVETLMPLAAGASADLADAARQSAEALAPRANVARVRIDLDVPDDPVPVVGEAQRIARVVDNLLDNALRHSPEGGTVCVRVVPGESTAELIVEDDGPGVPARDAPNLFKRLRQGKGATGQAGLGLYFCRITAENWGGSVGYEPGASDGARFWVRLPRVTAGR